MNFLIIGGNGYIGSKITRELIIDGHSVVCTKRSSSNLKRLSDVDEKVRWIPASIDGIETAMQYVNFDYVLNLACNYGRGGFFNDEVIEANIEFPLKVLNTAVKYGISKYLTIGTGLPDKFNMYSFTKKVFSEFGRFYAEKHHITFINMLLEMFYGADEPKDRFIPATISKMIKGETVETTIGNQRRDIISVSDIIMAINNNI